MPAVRRTADSLRILATTPSGLGTSPQGVEELRVLVRCVCGGLDRADLRLDSDEVVEVDADARVARGHVVVGLRVDVDDGDQDAVHLGEVSAGEDRGAPFYVHQRVVDCFSRRV